MNTTNLQELIHSEKLVKLIGKRSRKITFSVTPIINDQATLITFVANHVIVAKLLVNNGQEVSSPPYCHILCHPDEKTVLLTIRAIVMAVVPPR